MKCGAVFVTSANFSFKKMERSSENLFHCKKERVTRMRRGVSTKTCLFIKEGRAAIFMLNHNFYTA